MKQICLLRLLPVISSFFVVGVEVPLSDVFVATSLVVALNSSITEVET